ncbi:Periplasmic pH-dependent serine endoprotease DegQ [Pandoraea fibrosis]|uniref:Periplasmic pH-dependent serine endoprotease DegQ n=2 Tax=Pandoraea fibrosis TaxID=1891094 RepID=A0A5E4W8J1_9BURK|nr:Periplasmic pH-dependent serine endoprotease DegQ [Pandoraea fibrosis]
MTAPPVARAPMNTLRVGQKVYTLGSPSGQELSLADGIISSLHLDTDERISLIQTSAPVSPGSSGGGLFDTEGRLIGLTTAVLEDARHLNQNLNYAIPANFIDELPSRSRAAIAARETADSHAAAAKQVAQAREAAAGTFDVLRVEYHGALLEVATRNQGRSMQSTPYDATIWYSPQLNRVIKMRVSSMSTFTQINETIELTAMPGGQRVVAPRAMTQSNTQETSGPVSSR